MESLSQATLDNQTLFGKIINLPPLKQQFKASLEQFYIFNYAAEEQHERVRS